MNQLSVDIAVGGLRWDLRLHGFTKETLDILEKDLSCFLDSSFEDPVIVNMQAFQLPDIGENGGQHEEPSDIIFDQVGPNRISIKGLVFRGMFDGREVNASVRNTRDSVVSALMSLLVLVGASRGVTLLHASSVVIADRGYIFCGSTSAGKTTLAREFLAGGWLVLGDEMSCVGNFPEDPVLYPVPFNSTRSRIVKPVRLERICFLDGHESTLVEKVTLLEAMKQIARHSLYATLPANDNKKLLRNIGAIAEHAGVSRLQYRRGELEKLISMLSAY